MFLHNFISYYEKLLQLIAEFTVHTLELIGITIVVIGAFNALTQLLSGRKREHHVNVMVNLGRALALALEFKMGAEIVNTVIVRNLEATTIFSYTTIL